MEKISKQQIIAINTIISKKGLTDFKKDIITNASNGRTGSSSELYSAEAYALLQALNKSLNNDEARQKMVRKLFAMAHEMGWITEKMVSTKQGLKMKKDYSPVYNWVKKYGYGKKDLNQYTYEELPKLVTQFELHVYKPFLKKL